ncbi:MAG TPA: HAD hydrolase family protein [Candidatus Acidoferrales bacterium]|nr:HAD hydrolase family protein [Candidatus Acidoferrales bacterium]
MIKAIILDVDGVIIGEKIGYNSPHPHPDVVVALKKVREKGIAVCLCTAKPHYSIAEEINQPNLHNPHIADAGAVIIDPIDKIIVEKHVLDKGLVKEILHTLREADVYVEFYTVEDYFIQKDSVSETTIKHTHILQRDPVLLTDIVEESGDYEITKIMPIGADNEDKKRISDVLEKFNAKASISWGVHPVALPLQFGIITAPESSKKEGAEAIVKSLGISFDDVLGIGDSTSDWNFIQLCGYGATLSNGTEELKENIKSKGEGKYFVSKGSVDENGLLEILQYFIK